MCNTNFTWSLWFLPSIAIVEPFVPPEALKGRVPIRRGRKAIILWTVDENPKKNSDNKLFTFAVHVVIFIYIYILHTNKYIM